MKLIAFTKQNSTSIFLIIITVLGFLFRILGQPNHPSGFYQDEAGIAYSAYSILKTGRDEWNRFLPLHFKALGDYPPGGYNYSVVPFIAVFGLTEISERLPSIILGSLLIPLSYLFVYKFFRRRDLGLIVAAVLALSPWDIVQSRSGSEPVVALFMTLLAWLLFKKWVFYNKPKYLIATLISYFIAIFTYNAVKLALPLLHALVVWYLWPSVKAKKQTIITIPIILMLSIYSVFGIKGADISPNNSFVGYKIDQQSNQAYFFREGTSGVPTNVSRAIRNKVTSIVTSTLGRTLGYLDADFLFFQGGLPGRYKIPGIGQILLILLPFLVISLRQRKLSTQRDFAFLIIWILISLLPGILFVDFYPHVKRTMYLYLPLYILASYGIVYYYKQKLLFKPFVSLILGLSLLWNLAHFTNQYFVHANYETVLARSYGWKDVYDYLKTHDNSYDNISVYSHNEDPVVFYLFYNQTDPRKIQSVASSRPTNVFLPIEERTSWSFEEYTFYPQSCPSKDDLDTNILFVTIAECLNKDSGDLTESSYTILKTTYMPDKSPRFVIFTKS